MRPAVFNLNHNRLSRGVHQGGTSYSYGDQAAGIAAVCGAMQTEPKPGEHPLLTNRLLVLLTHQVVKRVQKQVFQIFIPCPPKALSPVCPVPLFSWLEPTLNSDVLPPLGDEPTEPGVASIIRAVISLLSELANTQITTATQVGGQRAGGITLGLSIQYLSLVLTML